MERVTWKATVHEKNGRVTHPVHVGYDTTREYVIDFFGLDGPDVESYELERVVGK